MREVLTWGNCSMFLWILDIIWLIIILYLSHTNGEHTAKHSKDLQRLIKINEHLLRQIAHIACYMVLGALWSLTVGTTYWLLLLVPVLVLDEATKQFIPGRHTSTFEMGLNVIGAAVGIMFIWSLHILM